MPVKFVFFDVDETLVHLNGSARTAMRAALTEVFGVAGPVEDFPMAGKTDRQIFGELLKAAGVPAETVRRRMDVLLTTYCRVYPPVAIQAGITPCPGVLALTGGLAGWVARGALKVGLLTGNLECLPFPKLEAVGIDSGLFELGAYGSDATDRKVLARIAQQRASQLIGAEVSPGDITVIGDTPEDIACARAIGAKAMAVATGQFSVITLDAYHPDHLFFDFSDPERVIAAIFA